MLSRASTLCALVFA
jgi:hypothetical protein